MVIVYRIIPQYRRRFYELLRESLLREGVELILVYGQPGQVDEEKKDSVDLPWAHRIKNTILTVRGKEIYWQPCLSYLRNVDLVVVEQASRLLVNYVLFAQNILRLRKLAFWGHGRTFQAHPGSRLAENVKVFMSRRVHWWFAYNKKSAEWVMQMGFPPERITTVQNAIDTSTLVRYRSDIDAGEVENLRVQTGIRGANVCIFSGGMYRDKRLDFLISACRVLKEKIPDFEMIFIGDGPDARVVKAAACRYSWIHYAGPRFEREKVPYFMMSKLLLIPGRVGLAVLDAFALETPLVTTGISYHSPEIEYLRPGENGELVMRYDDVETYANVIAGLLTDEEKRMKLVAGCRTAREKYTIEAMAGRFAEGTIRALSS